MSIFGDSGPALLLRGLGIDVNMIQEVAEEFHHMMQRFAVALTDMEERNKRIETILIEMQKEKADVRPARSDLSLSGSLHVSERNGETDGGFVDECSD